MPQFGRPPVPAEERHRVIGLSLKPSAIAALRELSRLRDEPQGAIVGHLVEAALKRDQARAKLAERRAKETQWRADLRRSGAGEERASDGAR